MSGCNSVGGGAARVGGYAILVGENAAHVKGVQAVPLGDATHVQ
jgi:hypothetical protein